MRNGEGGGGEGPDGSVVWLDGLDYREDREGYTKEN